MSEYTGYTLLKISPRLEGMPCLDNLNRSGKCVLVFYLYGVNFIFQRLEFLVNLCRPNPFGGLLGWIWLRHHARLRFLTEASRSSSVNMSSTSLLKSLERSSRGVREEKGCS